MRVIIIGKGAGKEHAPYAAENAVIWGVNNVCLMRTVNLVFNMHDLEKHKDHKLFKKTIEYANRNNLSVVCQKQYHHIARPIPFPMWWFEQEKHRMYFTNSIDYMVAYAYFLRMRGFDDEAPPDEIVSWLDLYGVVMATGTEYQIQRPSLEYWLGVFEGSGGNVTVRKPSFVLTPPTEGLYGYDWDEEHLPHVKEREENK